MKKNYLLLLIFLISCSQGAPEEFQSGEEVYEARCSACHGPNFEGRVGPSIDSNSPSASMPDSYWVQTIFNNIKINIGDFSNWVLNSDDNDYLIDLNYENNLENYFEDLYEINQEVKIEENQYHFIDHHYFGIIVRISSL